VKGQIVKIISNRYTVECGDATVVAHALGKLKVARGDFKGQSSVRQTQNLMAGDFVRLSHGAPFAVIEEVIARKNFLMRPPVANVDLALIVIANEPVADFLLLDKILINCYIQEIKPIIVYNKCDIAKSQEVLNALKPYENFVDSLVISAVTGEGFEELKPLIDKKLAVLAGQSAVGKTSILNRILGANLKTDTLSLKISRGKHTTRHIEIFNAYGGKIADTCGFSLLEILNVSHEELRLYYNEFLELPNKCRFTACNHISEPDCAVRVAVENGEIDKGRYERYITLYTELLNNK